MNYTDEEYKWLKSIGVDMETEDRLSALRSLIEDWINAYSPKTIESEKEGIGVLLFVDDRKTNKTLQFYHTYGKDGRESLVQTINHGIGDIFHNSQSFETFNSISEYFVRLYEEYPEIWETFKEAVEKRLTNSLNNE